MCLKVGGEGYIVSTLVLYMLDVRCLICRVADNVLSFV